MDAKCKQNKSIKRMIISVEMTLRDRVKSQNQRSDLTATSIIKKKKEATEKVKKPRRNNGRNKKTQNNWKIEQTNARKKLIDISGSSDFGKFHPQYKQDKRPNVERIRRKRKLKCLKK